MLRCLLLLVCLLSGWARVQQKSPESPGGDPFLTQARQSVVDSAETLDSFLCDKHIRRYHRDSETSAWQDKDVIDAEVAFDRGTGERYRNVKVNGVASKVRMMDLSGSNSLGEFALDLRNLFDAIGNDSFHLQKIEPHHGQLIRIYTYAVGESASNWKIEQDGRSVMPAFVGSLWIAAESRQVVHLEMSASSLPASFTNSMVSMTVDYGPVTIPSQKPRYLPIAAEAQFCNPQRACDRNVIHFDKYRQFSAESTLSFTAPPTVIAPVLTPPPSSLSIPDPWDPQAVHFAGIAHPRTRTTLALELDDERFVNVDLRTPGTFPIHEGDRLQISTASYDGRGVIAESVSKIGSAPAAKAAVDHPVQTPAVEIDAIVRQARQAEADLLRSLPNYLCTENVKRYQSWPDSSGWQLLDHLSTDVVYRRQFGETYRNVRINDKPTSRHWREVGGDVSTGEFGTMLRSLLADGTAAFHFVKNTRVDGLPAAEYTFTVPHSRSDWEVRVDYQFIMPAYSGRIWFDQQFGRVLRLERKADDIPARFPLSNVTSKVTFGQVRLRATNIDLLPLRAESLLCMKKSRACSRKIMEFTDYRLFTADSTLKF